MSADVEENESLRDAENFHCERNERARKNGAIDFIFVSRDLAVFRSQKKNPLLDPEKHRTRPDLSA